MVSIVIVSHLQRLAEAVVEAAKLMAKDVNIAAVGGKDNGEPGASAEKISRAIDSVYTEEGVLVIADIGSSVMVTKTVIEEKKKNNQNVQLVNCPFFEGAIAASVTASCSLPIDMIIQQAEQAKK